MKVFHLKISRVSGTNPDSTSRIETITVKLTGEPSLIKYCKFVTINGYVKEQPPMVVKVIDTKDTSKALAKSEITKAQEIVDNILQAVPGASKDLDYKALHELQKKRNDDLEKRLKALEKPKAATVPEAEKQVKPKEHGK